MDKPDRHDTGILAQDSPALYGALKRTCALPDITLLENIYSSVVKAGALDEGSVQRNPGVSFNPRPARICKILLREVNETDPLLFGAAMLLCVPQKPVSLPDPVPIPGCDLMVALAQSYRAHFISANSPAPSESIERLHLALLIDEVRHLHMTTISGEAKRLVLAPFYALYQEHCHFSANEPLRRILHAAVGRVEISFCGVNNA